jgi:hypothetical protein
VSCTHRRDLAGEALEELPDACVYPASTIARIRGTARWRRKPAQGGKDARAARAGVLTQTITFAVIDDTVAFAIDWDRSVALALLVVPASTLSGVALRVVETRRAGGQKRGPLTVFVRAAPAFVGQAVAVEFARAPVGQPLGRTEPRRAQTDHSERQRPYERFHGSSSLSSRANS